MSSVRLRNGRYYYRATICDQNGKTHWIEHGGFSSYEEARRAGEYAYPTKTKPFKCTRHLAEIIFERFPENHPAHIPLKLLYYLNLKPKEIYNIKLNDIDLNEKVLHVGSKVIFLFPGLLKLLSRQVDKILKNCMTFLVKTEYLNCYFPSGKPILVYQMDYISKVIRRTINPSWSPRKFYMGFNETY